MKRAKFDGKLSLRKETVARLNDAQMSELKGGSVYANTAKCYLEVKDIKPVQPCTISFNPSAVINSKEVVVIH